MARANDMHRSARVLGALRRNALTVSQVAEKLRDDRMLIAAHVHQLARKGKVTAVGEVVGDDGRRRKQWLAA